MRFVGVLAGSFLLVAGCSATVADDEADADIPEATVQGSVAVQRTVALTGQPSTPVRTHVSARFMRVGGELDHETAERVVGAAPSEPTLGTCGWHQPTGTEPLPSSAARGSIELLDVGEIVVHAGTTTMPLAARAFPDVGEIVSGVMYTSRDDDADVPAGGTYLIETSGSGLIEGFSAQVDAPTAPTGIQVDEHDLSDEDASVAPGQALTLRWHPGNPAAGDRIYVEIVPMDDSDDQPVATLRCSFEDDGYGLVPGQLTEWQHDAIAIAVHRLRRTTLRVAGIDQAMVEFDFGVRAELDVSE